MIELINNEYRSQGLPLASAHSHKKMPMELKEKFKLEEDLFILREIDKAVSKLLGTDLKLLKSISPLSQTSPSCSRRSFNGSFVPTKRIRRRRSLWSSNRLSKGLRFRRIRLNRRSLTVLSCIWCIRRTN